MLYYDYNLHYYYHYSPVAQILQIFLLECLINIKMQKIYRKHFLHFHSHFLQQSSKQIHKKV